MNYAASLCEPPNSNFWKPQASQANKEQTWNSEVTWTSHAFIFLLSIETWTRRLFFFFFLCKVNDKRQLALSLAMGMARSGEHWGKLASKGLIYAKQTSLRSLQVLLQKGCAELSELSKACRNWGFCLKTFDFYQIFFLFFVSSFLCLWPTSRLSEQLKMVSMRQTKWVCRHLWVLLLLLTR